MTARVVRGGAVEDLAAALDNAGAAPMGSREVTAALIVATRLIVDLTRRVDSLELELARLRAASRD
jgi:hypothetical protein